MNKELSNEQRTRLEKIAKDEFRMKKEEIETEKRNALNDWMDKEEEKILKTKECKELITLEKRKKELYKKIEKMGFQSNNLGPKIKFLMSTNRNCYSNKKIHPEWKKRQMDAKMNDNKYTRNLNEVLAVIWSMEKPFSECMKLIKQKAKLIK